MTPFKSSLAIGALLLSSASLALAQGAGIAPSGANLPAQTNVQGTAQNPAGSAQTTHAKKVQNVQEEHTPIENGDPAAVL